MPRITTSHARAHSHARNGHVQRKASKNSVKFTGKLSGGGELTPGGYTITMTAEAADGKSSKPISLKLTIAT